MKGLKALCCILILWGCGGGGNNANDEIDDIMVYIDNGAIQCDFQGYSVDETAKTLTDNGIEVIESHCGYITGMAITAVCGASTNEIHLHVIVPTSLDEAVALGFISIDTIINDPEIGYVITECPNE